MTVMLLVPLAAALITTLVAEAVRRYALSRALLDHPGPRSSHHTPTPRGGGLGIVVAMLMLAPVLGIGAGLGAGILAPFGLALAATALVGALDDLRSLSPWPRLAVHAGAGVLLAAWLLPDSGLAMPLLLALAAVVVLAVMTAINVWNFMDGIDTLAVSQAGVIALALVLAPGLAVSEPEWRGLAWVLAAACMAFLGFNWPPARLFLGDVGSGALGLAIATLLVQGIRQGDLPWQAALIMVSAFLCDAGFTLAGRIWRREPWWQAHRQHLYQWAVRSGHGHGVVSLTYLLWTLAALLLANGLAGVDECTRTAAVFGVYLLAGIIWRALIGHYRERAGRDHA